MVANFRNLKAIVAATAVIVTFSVPCGAWADTGSARPTSEAELLTALKAADATASLGIARELESLWQRSGSPAMDLLLRRGTQALERGDLSEAVEHLTALTDHAPEFARGWYERARAYFEAGLYGPAVADLERALYLNPNDYDAIFALGNVLEHFQDPAAAFAAYSRAQAIHPHHEEVTKALDRLQVPVIGKTL